MRSILSFLYLAIGLPTFGQYVLPNPQLLKDSGVHRIEIYHEALGTFNMMSKDTLSLEHAGEKYLEYVILLDDSARIIEEIGMQRDMITVKNRYTYDSSGRLVEIWEEGPNGVRLRGKVNDLPNGNTETLFFNERMGSYRRTLVNPEGICIFNGFYRETDSTIITQDPEKFLRTQVWYNAGKLDWKREWQWILSDGKATRYIERHHQYVKYPHSKIGSSEEVFQVNEDGSLKLRAWFKDDEEYTSKRFKNWHKPGEYLRGSSIPMVLNEYKVLWENQSHLITFSGEAEYFNLHYIYQ